MNGRGLLAMLALGAEGVAMGSRFACTVESPLHDNIKQQIVKLTENDTIYGKNFDGIYARVVKTPTAVRLIKKPMNPILAAYKSFGAAKLVNLPLWKVIPGLLLHWSKMYQLSLFGAATSRIMTATVDGDIDNGVQFIGQTQGLIHDIPTVQDLVDRCVQEAANQHEANGKAFSERTGTV